MRLDAPDWYWKLSQDAISDIANGCGPKHYGHLVPDTVWGMSVRPACQIHDCEYHFGNTEQDRTDADERFGNNLALMVEHYTHNRFLKWLRLFRVETYVYQVKESGGKAFWEGKNV